MHPIQPVAKDFLYMKIADAIHGYIRENQLQPGDKIPSERTLAEQLRTGRNSVREAMRILEHEGILEVKTGRGAFVVAPVSITSMYLKLFNGNYHEMLEVKTILEKEVVRKAVHLATPEQLDALERHLVVMEEMAARGVYADAQDRLFHQELLRVARNRTLEKMVNELILALSEYATQLPGAEEIFVTTIPCHRQIVEAIRQRDEEAACAACFRLMEIDITALDMGMR